MKKLLIPFLLLFCTLSTSVHADIGNTSWITPTTRTSGAVLLPSTTEKK